MTSYRVIGQDVPRTDGPEKVTGEAQYTADFVLPGTLWGKVLRSPFPHARILSIDTAEASKIEGVYAVLTGADVRGVLYGRRLKDVPVLANDVVRHIGEPVAAVSAIDQDTAQQALDLIDVEYEELPAVLDTAAALKDGASLVHPEVNSYAGLPKILEKPSNQFVKNTWSTGNLEHGMAAADRIFENSFTTPAIHQAYLESHSCLVWIDEDDRVQVWASNKNPHVMKQQMSDALHIPVERIRINQTFIGGDFGGKGSPLNLPLCYFLALHSGRPVKIVMNYSEELLAANPRHPSEITLKTGVMNDGTLVAHEAYVIFNSGAYGGFKPGVNLSGASRAGGCYRIPNVYMEGVQVYTNNVPCGHMRSPGEPQALFAMESHMDMIARELGIEPLELRRRNLVEEGDETPSGTIFEGVRAKETLEAAIDASEYNAPKPANVGRGIAMGDRAPGGGESYASVELKPDGSVVLSTPVFEQGTGTHTTLRQIVAEEMGLPFERVQLEVWNTDAVPFDSGVGGNRVTRIASIATNEAVLEAQHRALRITAELTGWPEERLKFQGEEINNTESGQSENWARLLSRAGQSVVGSGHYKDAGHAKVTSFTAQVAEVAVDPDTGEIKLIRVTTAHDVGRVLNPVGHQGQIFGGLMQGIGYALMEELVIEDGRVTNLSLGDYKIPTFMDLPEVRTVLLEPGKGVGPYDTKAIGESPNGPIAAAIANAIADAVGVRIQSLPLTSEKVYRALKDG